MSEVNPGLLQLVINAKLLLLADDNFPIESFDFKGELLWGLKNFLGELLRGLENLFGEFLRGLKNFFGELLHGLAFNWTGD